MNRVLIVDASESDHRLMSGLLVKSGYEPITVENMEAAKEDVAKLASGAVIFADYRLPDGSAKELVNWQKGEGQSFPVIAIVNNLNGSKMYARKTHQLQKFLDASARLSISLTYSPPGKRARSRTRMSSFDSTFQKEPIFERSSSHIDKLQAKINRRPREKLSFSSPLEQFFKNIH